MEEYKISKVTGSDYFYNLAFFKEVHKRTGKIAWEPDETIYGLPKDIIINKISHEKTFKQFGDADISLSDYLKKFYINYSDVKCELSKKIL